jgi:hypothetical protein
LLGLLSHSSSSLVNSFFILFLLYLVFSLFPSSFSFS